MGNIYTHEINVRRDELGLAKSAALGRILLLGNAFAWVEKHSAPSTGPALSSADAGRYMESYEAHNHAANKMRRINEVLAMRPMALQEVPPVLEKVLAKAGKILSDYRNTEADLAAVKTALGMDDPNWYIEAEAAKDLIGKLESKKEELFRAHEAAAAAEAEYNATYPV